MGLSEREITAIKAPDRRPFRPAYVDGIRREVAEAKGKPEGNGTFRERFYR